MNRDEIIEEAADGLRNRGPDPVLAQDLEAKLAEASAMFDIEPPIALETFKEHLKTSHDLTIPSFRVQHGTHKKRNVDYISEREYRRRHGERPPEHKKVMKERYVRQSMYGEKKKEKIQQVKDISYETVNTTDVEDIEEHQFAFHALSIVNPEKASTVLSSLRYPRRDPWIYDERSTRETIESNRNFAFETLTKRTDASLPDQYDPIVKEKLQNEPAAFLGPTDKRDYLSRSAAKRDRLFTAFHEYFIDGPFDTTIKSVAFNLYEQSNRLRSEKPQNEERYQSVLSHLGDNPETAKQLLEGRKRLLYSRPRPRPGRGSEWLSRWQQQDIVDTWAQNKAELGTEEVVFYAVGEQTWNPDQDVFSQNEQPLLSDDAKHTDLPAKVIEAYFNSAKENQGEELASSHQPQSILTKEDPSLVKILHHLNEKTNTSFSSPGVVENLSDLHNDYTAVALQFANELDDKEGIETIIQGVETDKLKTILSTYLDDNHNIQEAYNSALSDDNISAEKRAELLYDVGKHHLTEQSEKRILTRTSLQNALLPLVQADEPRPTDHMEESTLGSYLAEVDEHYAAWNLTEKIDLSTRYGGFVEAITSNPVETIQTAYESLRQSTYSVENLTAVIQDKVKKRYEQNKPKLTYLEDGAQTVLRDLERPTFAYGRTTELAANIPELQTPHFFKTLERRHNLRVDALQNIQTNQPWFSDAVKVCATSSQDLYSAADSLIWQPSSAFQENRAWLQETYQDIIRQERAQKRYQEKKKRVRSLFSSSM